MPIITPFTTVGIILYLSIPKESIQIPNSQFWLNKVDYGGLLHVLLKAQHFW